MKNFIIIFCIIGASCCSTKTKTAAPADNVAVGTEKPSVTDSVVAPPIPSGKEQTPTTEVSNSAMPACIKKMTDQFSAEEKQNPPRKIYSYTYQGKTVYYVTPPCCDFFSDLYDSDCKLLGHPDGGITGRGDGKFADFEKEKSNEKLVWADKRK